MPAELNFFDTYTLMAVYKRVVPKKTFFRDRYFPTSDEDIFASNKVLTWTATRRWQPLLRLVSAQFRWSAWATRSMSLNLHSSA